MALPTPTVTYRTSQYGATNTLASSNYTVMWKYEGGSTVTVAEHAGTYTATITHTGDNWYSGNGTGTVTTTRTYTVNRANNSVSAPSFAEGNTWEYGQTPHIPNSSALDGEITFEISANGTSGWQPFSSLTTSSAPNKWYVRASVAQTVDYNAATSGNTQIEITKATVTVTPGNETAEWRNPFEGIGMDYITPTVSGLADWSVAKNHLQWKQVEPVVNAEQGYAYTLESNGSSNDYYNFVVDGNGTVNITKNTKASVGGGGNGADQTYSGAALTLTPGTALAYRDELNNEAGTVQYKITAPAAAVTDWLDDIPTATNAATYTVIYKGVGDQNHTDSEDAAYTYNVTINPYELVEGTDFTAPTAKTDGVYTGSAQDIAIAGEFKGKFAEELAAAGAKFIYPTADALPQQTNANENYSFSWNIDLGTSTNFSYTAGATTVTGAKIAKAFITSADYTLPEAVPDLVYNNTNLTLHTALVWNVTPAPGEAHYNRSDVTDWPTTLRYRNIAGDWTISTAIIPDDNHTFEAGSYISTVTIGGQTAYVVQNDLEVSIAPAEVTIASNGTVDTKVFDGTAQGLVATAPTFTGVGGANVAGTVTYAWNDGEGDKTATTAAGVVATNAGEYAITYTFVPTSDNYKPIEEAQALEGAEAKAKIEQFTLYVGGNEVKGTIEDVYDLENEKPLISNSDFLDVNKIKTQFPAADADGIAKAAEILDQLVSPVQTLDEIFANAKVATNTVALKKVDVAPAPGAPMNYKIDEATLLSNAASLTITAKEAAIQAAPVGDATLAYTGENQELVETAATGYKANGGAGTVAIGKVVYSLEEDGTYTDDLTAIVGKDADEYEVFYKVELSTEATSYDRFYEYTAGVKSIKVTIAQAANEITNLALEGWTYGEEANTPVAEAKFAAEGEPTFTYSDSETGTFSEEVPTAAGTWYVKASVAETTNWAAAEKTISFEIAQAEATIATAPVAKELVYNREAQELVEAGVSNDGTVMYSLTGEATDFAEEIPTGTDAGEYEVYYMVKGDANHTDLVVAEPVVVTIAPADVEDIVAPVAINLTYNGYDQVLAEAATFEDEFVKGTFKYSVDGGENWFDNIEDITGKNAGEYTIMTEFTPNKNHNEATVADVTVTINKATIGYTLSNLEKTWNGEPFDADEIATLFTLTAGGDGTKLFGDDEYDKPFTLSLPEDYRDAGTYTFKQPKVEFKEGYPVNYNVNFTGEAEVVINKADIVAADFTAPAAIAGVIYTGEEKDIVEAGEVTTTYQYPEMEEALAIGTMVYATAKDAEEWAETAPKGTEAGDYEVYFKVVGDKNHNDFEATLIEDVAIATATLTADFLPEEYETELPYKAAAYEAKDFIPALVGIEEAEGYEVYASEMKDADEYVITFKGINNYAGEFDVAVKVTPIDVIAVAPKGIKKVYDGTASLEGVITNEDITFVGVLSGDQITVPEALALSTEGIAVNDKPYAITVDAAAINAIEANKNYNILEETIDGTLTITKAPAFKVGFDEVPVWTKAFGDEDPALTGYTVAVTDGDFFDNIDDVLAATTAERAEGEDVDTYDVTLTIDATADVFKNYEGVEFDGTAAEFEITKADKTYTVSLANITETYKAEEFATAIEFAAEDLVIAGYEGDKAKFFTTLPTATLAAGAKTVGNYNITLAGGESQNYNFTFVPATFTIEPFTVTEATIADQKVQKGKELDVTAFTITVPGEDADYFYVTAPGLVDMNDIVTGDKGVYEDGLVIAVDAAVADNYAGLDAFTADLEIIAADAIILADDATFETEAKENADVTFSSRSINSNKWNVCALPFATTVSQISEAFGYAVVDVLNETNAIDNEMHFKVITSGDIPAYTPFLFKPTEDDDVKVTNFDQVVFSGVNIEKGGNKNYDVADAAGNKFWGTFMETTTFYGAKYWYMSKGVWKDAANYTEAKPVSLKPFRAYCEIVNPAGARIVIEEEDGTLTSIDAASFNNEVMTAEGWYTIEGKKLNAAPTQKGVYIQNGQKVVIK